MKTDGNEQAFPTITFDSEGRICTEYEGLTKREIFAMAAMQKMTSFDLGPNNEVAAEIAKRAVIQADALITELNKDPNEN